MNWLFVEKNSASDTEIEVLDVLAKPGARVSIGTALVELEGAKAIFEVEAVEPGFFYPYVSRGEVLKIGAVLGLLSNVELSLDSLPQAPSSIELRVDNAETPEGASSDVLVSEAARELLLGNNIEFGEIATSGFISEKMVQDYLSLKLPVHAPAKSKNLDSGKIAILGGGNGAQIIHNVVSASSQYVVSGVFDDRVNSLASEGVPLLGALLEDEIAESFKNKSFDGVIISISSNVKLRAKLFEMIVSLDIPLATVIHPNAYVNSTAKIGPGSLILDLARLGPFAQVAENVFLSAFVNIEHHCKVGKHCTFGPGVFLSGEVNVGEGCVFGTQVSVEPKIEIGAHSVIASGVVLTKSIVGGARVKSEQTLHIRS